MISDFPAVEKWVPFEKLWEVNEDAITTANKKYGNKYSSILKDTISEVADETGVNAELILAMVMQEVHTLA
jgi:membrane-bound lytic murein transglycosylase B